MKKNIILSIVFFIAGFLIHAFFFSDFLANGFADSQDIIPVTNTQIAHPTETDNPLVTKITFDGEHFNRHNVTIENSRYITITNINKDNKPMTLVSNNPILATPRGYGFSEAIQTRLDTKGKFVVADKDNQQERLLITVK